MTEESNSENDPNAPTRRGELVGFEVDDPTGRKGLLRIVLVMAAFIGALALIPMTLGFGPFGMRLIASDEIDVHVLNLSGTDLDVQLSFASEQRVTAGTMEVLTTLSGGARLVAKRPDGTVVDDLEFDADRAVFYNAGGGRCFAVFDISSLYSGEDVEQTQAGITVAARLDEDTRIYPFDADTVVLPRRVAPDQARGVVHWIEPVGCNLLDPDEESFLIGQNFVRLQHRRERYEEELRQAREAAAGGGGS